MKHARKETQKEDSTGSMLNSEGELGCKNLSAQFYHKINSISAQNDSTEITSCYFLPRISQFVLNTLSSFPVFLVVELDQLL